MNTLDIAQLSLAEFKKIKLKAIQDARKSLDAEEAELRGDKTIKSKKRVAKVAKPKNRAFKKIDTGKLMTATISDLLKSTPDGLTNYQIANKTEIPVDNVRWTITRLIKQGECEVAGMTGREKIYKYKKKTPR